MTQQQPAKLSIDIIREARKRIQSVVQQTPLDYSATFSQFSDNEIYLKLENLQKTGSFKIRGAYNKITTLTDDERSHGVIAASAGNHAQGVAFAARGLGVPCTIVMPEGASLAKIAATQRYGAKVVLEGASYDDAYAHALSLSKNEGYTYVHAFDDEAIVAGQGTIGLEILEQLPDVDAIVIPMGGGGLAAGTALAVKALRPDVKIYGVEASAVPSFRHSLDMGHPETVEAQSTIADGIAVKRPGDLTYRLAQQYVDDVVLVEEEEISRAMVLLLERCKIVAEGAAATSIAAVINKKIPNHLGKVVCILSGGNVDVTVLSRIIEHGLIESGRYLRMAVTLLDRPGALRDLLDILASLRVNVLSVQHHRVGTHIHLGQTEVELDLETRDKAHIELIYNTLQQRGYTPVPRD
ncbi:threonine ammonia-lyase [Alicyclobacillus fastidiosus]|uniref:L-threonine dehydratase catabolic TdcB n=1 Tax=Alicyclobacillus fastidiosus TaxID=392011 RepID=A0ABV5AFL3_9BACL|nr:threonine ammonia-lyase [Alicyclobacillus fastidiosus]WEH11630.1 threonine ammonia-lyase [Alicyclobacillus fastidiosus]